ncbi:MAG: hypothetical protein OEW87_08320, partial [Flavobacteriaceae bacterium]|nr:hypothetical protein [Flavobacteriaceae bacterium]
MIRSMTGYGKAILELPRKKISIEIKTLNSKNLDLNVRLPSCYREKELELRSKLSQLLVRGKVDFSIFIDTNGGETTTTINKEVVNNYIDQLREIAITSPENTLEVAMRLPDVLKTEREELDEKEWIEIDKTINEAVVEVNQFRSDEGMVLKKDFSDRIKTIQKLSEQVVELDEERLRLVREKLEKSIADLKQNVDENRFEQ